MLPAKWVLVLPHFVVSEGSVDTWRHIKGRAHESSKKMPAIKRYVRRGSKKRFDRGILAQRKARDQRTKELRLKRTVLNIVRRNAERHFVDTSVTASGPLTYSNAARVVALDGWNDSSAAATGFTGEQARVIGAYWCGSVYMLAPPVQFTTTKVPLQLDVYLCTIEGDTLPIAGSFPGGDELPDYDFWKNNRIKLLKHKVCKIDRVCDTADTCVRMVPMRMYAKIDRRLNQLTADDNKNFRTFICTKVTGFDAGNTAKVEVSGSVRLSAVDV